MVTVQIRPLFIRHELTEHSHTTSQRSWLWCHSGASAVTANQLENFSSDDYSHFCQQEATAPGCDANFRSTEEEKMFCNFFVCLNKLAEQSYKMKITIYCSKN